MPLSFAQKRLWFLDQFSPNSPQYNLPTAIRLRGELNLGLFEQSITAIIERHESLRTNFIEVDGEPIQVIKPEIEFTTEEIKLGDIDNDQTEYKLRSLISEEARKPFNLSNENLFRIKILRLNKNDHVILATMHHIISDGWSMSVMIREIVQQYLAFSNDVPSPLEDLEIQYADFAAWQQNWLKGEVLDEQLNYWKSLFGTRNPILGLPTDHPRPALRSGRGESYFFELPASISIGIRDLSQKTGNTLFVTLLTAFAVLLHRYTDQSEIRIGTPIAGRNRRELEGLIGFFVNTLVMQTVFEDDPSFEQLLSVVQKTSVGAYSHQDLPFEMLVDALQPERDMSVPPLFQVMFSLQNAPTTKWEMPGLSVENLPVHSGTAKFDLSLILYEKQTAKTEYALGGIMEYDSDLFVKDTIERMMDHYEVLLNGIIDSSTVPVSELPILSENEYDIVVNNWSSNVDRSLKVLDTKDQTINVLFENQAALTPGNVAVVYEGNRLTYDQLNRKANQLAHYLIGYGVGPDDIVALCLDRSLDLIVGLLAIIKAGGAYLPLDPTYPAERITYMLSDSSAKIIVSYRSIIDGIDVINQSKDARDGETEIIESICLDEVWDLINKSTDETNPRNSVNPGNLAYVIYTSGSTGLPKGVMIEHHSVINLMLGLEKNIYLNSSYVLSPVGDNPNLNLSLNAPLPFDASVQQWIMLLKGHTLHLIPQDVRLDGDEILLVSGLIPGGCEKCFIVEDVLVGSPALPVRYGRGPGFRKVADRFLGEQSPGLIRFIIIFIPAEDE